MALFESSDVNDWLWEWVILAGSLLLLLALLIIPIVLLARSNRQMKNQLRLASLGAWPTLSPQSREGAPNLPSEYARLSQVLKKPEPQYGVLPEPRRNGYGGMPAEPRNLPASGSGYASVPANVQGARGYGVLPQQRPNPFGYGQVPT